MATCMFSAFRRERLKLQKEILHLDFLSLCKTLEVIPKFLRVTNKKLFSEFRNKSLIFENEILNLSIRKMYARINYMESKCSRMLHNLFNSFPFIIVNEFMNKLETIKENRLEGIERKQLRKIAALSSEFKPTFSQKPPFNFINISDRELSERESSVLGLGPKFVFRRKPNFRSLIPQLESILCRVNEENRPLARAEAALTIVNFQKSKPCFESSEIKTLMELRKDPSINIIQTDKTNQIAILNASEYTEKFYECVSGMKCTEIKNNPLEPLIKKVNILIKDKNWPDDIKEMVVSNPSALIPVLFGRLKEHKEGLPLRPIVAKCMSPLYILEKVVNGIIRDILPPTSFMISSTKDFIDRIGQCTIDDNEELVSLDIVSLFPSVDTIKAEEMIFDLLDKTDLQIAFIDLLKRTISLILRSNFFTFDGKIFLQDEGAPMGSPLSVTLAEFILRPMETLISDKHGVKFRLATRYVDDIFLIWNKSYCFNSFLEDINKIDQKIKFTSEIEKNNRINYLDVTIIRENGILLRKIYRKPTASKSFISKDSAAPWQYKTSALRSMLRRMHIVCSRKYMSNELSQIIGIANTNGFSSKTVLRINKRILDQIHAPNDRTEQNLVFSGSLDYTEILSERLVNVLKKYDIRVGLKMNGGLLKLLKKDRNQTPVLDRSGVYKIPITKENGENIYYVGMTKRRLTKRRAEHIYDISSGKDTTAMAKLNLQENIEINFDEIKIISPYTTSYKTLLRETIEIAYNKDKLCNWEPSTKLSPIWHKILKSTKSKSNRAIEMENTVLTSDVDASDVVSTE